MKELGCNVPPTFKSYETGPWFAVSSDKKKTKKKRRSGYQTRNPWIGSLALIHHTTEAYCAYPPHYGSSSFSFKSGCWPGGRFNKTHLPGCLSELSLTVSAFQSTYHCRANKCYLYGCRVNCPLSTRLPSERVLIYPAAR